MVKSSIDQPPLTPILTSKRKKEESEDIPAAKKQRTRVSFSCGECHRRKQKCDRKTPCSHCLARKVPELCQPYTPGKTDQDLSARLSRLEHIIEMALPQYCTSNATTPSASNHTGHIETRRSSSVGDDDVHSQADEQDSIGGTFHSGRWFGNSASGSLAPAPVLELLDHVVVRSSQRDDPDSNGKIIQSSGNISDGAANGPAAIIDAQAEPSPADNLKNLVQECGVSPHKISELLQELPPSRISDVLIDFYFDSINWTRYPISEKDFRAAYNSVRAHGADGIGAANPNDVRFLPLLFVVLAISVRLAPESIGGDARHRRVTSLRYYWSSRRSLLIAAAIQPDSLDIVLTRLLSARFLTFDRRITECWSQLGAAVCTAQALGLHRDGSTFRGMDSTQVEYRRRIWSYLYHADRSYALVLGRPNNIQDDYTSSKPPSNIDDVLPVARILNATPLSSPTPMTFVILRHQLASIIGRMVHHFQQVRHPSHYHEVITLDGELTNFIENLPLHFSFKPDKSLDSSMKFIPVHRFLLITEILFVRISLHRPYLLRRLRSERYSPSRTACFESAIKDFQVRQAFRERMPKETQNSLSNAYREFQTAMISGIYLVLQPRGHYAVQMHSILDGFLKDHEGIPDMDETTRRELKTIEFLKIKASQADNQESSRSRPIVPNGSEQAQMLLDLQHSSNGHPHTPKSAFTNAANPSTTPQTSPNLSYSSANLVHSPTFQRLQHAEYPLSPSGSGSGSPSADDESAAQSLLDHWCNTISNGPAMDGLGGTMGWPTPGPVDFTAWGGTPQSLVGTPDSRGLDASDWTYWETLVNQIRAPGS
ncbi:hypothetical protein EYR40_005226 [Pleurotus pulmonarius]|nr:hypothetical protein EYR40_005226 [Pleurotus pulmonarius]